MNLEEFIKQTDPEKFYDSSPEERLRFAQDYENMMAEIEQRDPCKVIELPKEYAAANPGVLGYYSGKVIALNAKYLHSKKPKIAGVSSFSFADMIETLTHEGRHAWQHYVIDHPEKHLVNKNIRMAFQMNFGRGYRNGTGNTAGAYAEYAAQLVEVDARHFSMDWIKYLEKRFREKDGIGIHELTVTYNKLYNAEELNAKLIVQYLDAVKLKEFEEKLKKELFPGVDTSDVSMFADAIDLLNTLDSCAFIDCRPVDTSLDVMIDFMDETGINGKADRTVLRANRLRVGKVKLF